MSKSDFKSPGLIKIALSYTLVLLVFGILLFSKLSNENQCYLSAEPRISPFTHVLLYADELCVFYGKVYTNRILKVLYSLKTDNCRKIWRLFVFFLFTKLRNDCNITSIERDMCVFIIYTL